MRTLFSVAAVLAVLITGCGGDNITPPNGIDVSGQWRYFGSLVSGDIACSSGADGTFQINQSGSQLTGTFQNIGDVCLLPDGRIFPITRSGQITNGSLDGVTIRFSLGSDWTHDGLASAVPGQPSRAMNGTSSLTVDFGGTIGTVTLFGSFTAAR